MNLSILALVIGVPSVSAFSPTFGADSYIKVKALASTADEVLSVLDNDSAGTEIPIDTDLENLSLTTTTENQTLEKLVTVNSEKKEFSYSLPMLLRPQGLKGYVGDVGFDPLGFSEQYEMEFLREAELKHGRAAMLAWVGWVAVDMGLRIYPFPDEWVNVKNSLSAHDALAYVPGDLQGWWYTPFGELLYLIGIIELFNWNDVFKMLSGEGASRAAGDLGCDILGILDGKTDEEVAEMKLSELKHARLGMLAFGGVVAQSAVMGATEFPYIGIAGMAQ